MLVTNVKQIGEFCFNPAYQILLFQHVINIKITGIFHIRSEIRCELYS